MGGEAKATLRARADQTNVYRGARTADHEERRDLCRVSRHCIGRNRRHHPEYCPKVFLQIDDELSKRRDLAGRISSALGYAGFVRKVHGGFRGLSRHFAKGEIA